MEVHLLDDYKQMSKRSADEVFELTRLIKHPLLCTASGDTPAGLYKELVSLINQYQTDVTNWSFVGLDEWAGMNGSDEGSCRCYLDRQLFHPLKTVKDNISFFDGKSEDLEKQCKQVDNFILQHGGIDVAILGIGINGHIGMNEPGSSTSSFSYITAIDPVTQKTGQKYFKDPKQLSHGITLGLATILNAKNIILLVSGRHKAHILKRMLEEEISVQLPASLLRNHKHFKLFLDRDAASLTDVINYAR